MCRVRTSVAGWRTWYHLMVNINAQRRTYRRRSVLGWRWIIRRGWCVCKGWCWRWSWCEEVRLRRRSRRSRKSSRWRLEHIDIAWAVAHRCTGILIGVRVWVQSGLIVWCCTVTVANGSGRRAEFGWTAEGIERSPIWAVWIHTLFETINRTIRMRRSREYSTEWLPRQKLRNFSVAFPVFATVWKCYN